MSCRAGFRAIRSLVLALAAACFLPAAPIHDAAGAGDVEKVRALLAVDRTAVDAKDGNGHTPLLIAAANGQIEVMKLLLEKGAAVDAKDSNGSTPLTLAVWQGYLDMAKLLLEKGAAVDAKTNEGFTPLMFAFL